MKEGVTLCLEFGTGLGGWDKVDAITMTGEVARAIEAYWGCKGHFMEIDGDKPQREPIILCIAPRLWPSWSCSVVSPVEINHLSQINIFLSDDMRLDVYKKNEAVFEEDIKILKLDIMLRDNALTELRKKFEKAEKERDDLKLTLEKFENSSKNLSKLLDSQICDKFKSGVGYDSQVFDSQVFDSQVNDRYKTGKGYHAVPPPYTGNFMPPKPDLVLADKDEYVFSESVTSVPAIATSEVKTSESKPKSVSEPLIEDWISNSENENERIEFKESIEKGNPRLELQEKGVIDSGCSRHMTRNKSYLSDYEEINGGFVAFGGDPKGGKITGKVINGANRMLILLVEFHRYGHGYCYENIQGLIDVDARVS
ncbi:hypothetical protein Tco_0557306 [Tanacetum coccineum]